MAQVKIARNGQVLGEYEESRISNLMILGSIKPNDHYWMEGMSDWETVFSKNWPRSNMPAPALKPEAPNWYRSSDSRILGGVCGGLAHKWGRPALLVRLFFFIVPLGLFVYPLLWLALKEISTASQQDSAVPGSAQPKGMPFVFKAFIALVAVYLLSLIIVGRSGEYDGDGRVVAYKNAKQLVLRALKSPSSANFPGAIEDAHEISYRSYVGKEHSLETVSAWVDAQNSFGATLRQRWTAAYITGKDSDYITPVYLELGGEAVIGSRAALNKVMEQARSGRLSEWLKEDASK